MEGATASFEQAIALKPGLAEAHNNLGLGLQGLGRVEEAMARYEQAIALKPDYAEAHYNLGVFFQGLGRVEEAIACQQKAMSIKPDFSEAHSNLLMTMHYAPNCNVQKIYDEHIKWNTQHVVRLSENIKTYRNSIEPNRKIRIGMVSGSFHRHPVGYMIINAIEMLNRESIELYCYSNNHKTDDLGLRIREACQTWRFIAGMKDEEVSALIEDDVIDILVDLSGHADKNRLLVFARKPAPVQVKWVGGQFNTTGMTAIDYFLSDWVETPKGCDKWYTEKIIRLPDGYVCYDPPHYAPPVNSLPALSNHFVTFGCFNNLAKVNNEVVVLWSRLLLKIKGSKLILITNQLNDSKTRTNFKNLFLQEGVSPDQLDLQGSLPHSKLLKSYNNIDIALDPFPYSGGLTTCEALWMGVPVITMPGPTFAGRHSATHLTNVGLKDWIVDSQEKYLEVVEQWCNDLEALAKLRTNLRQQVKNSPLCDAPRFARNLETVFRNMWQTWCKSNFDPANGSQGKR